MLDKIAHLARLYIPDHERQSMQEALSKTIAWINKLRELDTTGVEPLTHMTHEINRFREDIAHSTLSRQAALSLAPQQDQVYFRVPKVID